MLATIRDDVSENSATSQEPHDPEEHTDCISPNPDVFSYFTLTSVNEKKRYGHFTVDAFMSYLLVAVVLFIQCVLLFCVSNKVIAKNINWQKNIINTGKNWNIVGEWSGCNDGKSLCTMHDGAFSCAPPSVQLIGRWDELDLDKDDVWHRDEVLKARDDIRCKYAVDPIEVFDVLILLLKERSMHIWLHHEVQSGLSIPKPYFTYIMGDIAMCGYRNEDMCGNLAKRGVFDAAIKHGSAPRVGGNIAQALDYCHALLEPGGLCERILPSTYSTWKIESVQECKDPEYSQFVYTDPNNGDIKSLLEVDYDARERYEVAKTPVFITYKICIIFIWLLLIVSQLRELHKLMQWVFHVQVEKVKLQKEQEEEEARNEAAGSSKAAQLNRTRSNLKNEEIYDSVSWRHCAAMTAVTVVRIGMLCFLCYVGLTFLGRQTDYIGLLLDGVALLFIVEVEEILYERVLRQEARSNWQDRDPVPLKKYGPGFLAHRPDITDLIWFGVVALLAIAFQLYYTVSLVNPLYNALDCTCLSHGEMCYEAHRFSTSFWDKYWTYDVPASRAGIEALNNGLPLSDITPFVDKFQQEAMRTSSLLMVNSSMHDVVKSVGRAAVHKLQKHLRLQP